MGKYPELHLMLIKRACGKKCGKYEFFLIVNSPRKLCFVGRTPHEADIVFQSLRNDTSPFFV